MLIAYHLNLKKRSNFVDPPDEISEIYYYLDDSEDSKFSLEELFEESGMEGKMQWVCNENKTKARSGDRITITENQKKVRCVLLKPFWKTNLWRMV